MNPALLAAGKKIAQSDTTKKVALGLGVAVVGTVMYLLFRKSKEQVMLEEIAQDTQNTINNLKVDSNNTTIDDTKAALIATGLFNAMNRFGCDYKTAWELLAPLTADDLKFVIKKFSVKPYRFWGLSTSKNAKALDLIGWLKEEMKSSPVYWPKVKKKFRDANIPF